MSVSLSVASRKKSNGTVSYRAQLRVKESSVVIHQESRTFPKRQLAKQWGERRRLEILQEGATGVTRATDTLAQLVSRYKDEYADLNEGFGESKTNNLNFLEKTDLAQKRLCDIQTKDIIEHARLRRKSGVHPSTAHKDLSWIRILYRVARSAWGMNADISRPQEAIEFCLQHRIIGKSGKRDRRPTADELQSLDAYFARKSSDVPMRDIIAFAIHSARRQGEITRIRWSDNIESDHTGVVRDLKHPRNKKGNDKRFKYTKEAWDIAMRQPKIENEDRIFPFNSATVGNYFWQACNVLEIDDLHFHDLRHEATSRLFEAGYSITEVQQFTLHEDWNILKNYTHLRPGDVKHR